MPYPNEHSCRLEDPDKYDRFARKNCAQKSDGKCIDVIYGIKGGKSEIQALRYPKSVWTESAARTHCKLHKGFFEPAAKKNGRNFYDGFDTETIPRFQSDLTVRAYQIDLKTLDEENRSIEAVIATESRIAVFDLSSWRVIDEIVLLGGLRMPKNGQVPLLDSHDRTSVQKQYGSTRDFRVEGNKLIARNYYSKSPVAEHAWTLTREGHLTDNSIGYRIYQSKIVERGEQLEYAGRTFKATKARDLRIVTDWEIVENSVLPIGADRQAKMREDRLINSKRKESTMDFEKWLEQRGLVPAELGDEEREKLRAEFDAETTRQQTNGGDAVPAQRKDTADQPDEAATQAKRNEPTIDPEKVAQDAVRKERERVNAIRELAGDDVEPEVIERCISEGLTVDEARAEVLKAIRRNRPKVSVPGGIVREGITERTVLEDAILLRAGMEDAILEDKQNGEQRAEKADRYRDMSLIDICRHALQLDGRDVPTGREDLIRAAFSTTSLPIILGNVANKSMLRGYNYPDETWRQWCVIGSVTDFKTQTRARLTDTGELEEVGAGGEVKHGGAEEEYEQFSVSTYAKQFAVTRRDIINDDLRALTRIPQKWGTVAKRKIADLVYAHLLANGTMQDGTVLFHASHSNLNTSNGLSYANLSTAKIAFYKQTDKTGRSIAVDPAYLLVPPDLEATAKEILQSDYLIMAGSTDSTRPSKNIHKGTLQLVMERRLSNANLTGYSTTTWYLVADPNVADTLEVAFLNGRQQPTLERFNPGPDVLGVIYRIYHDVGVKALDFRTMQKNTA